MPLPTRDLKRPRRPISWDEMPVPFDRDHAVFMLEKKRASERRWRSYVRALPYRQFRSLRKALP